MSAVESFLREIVARPNDPAPRIALAEWLERFGDARDELIRLHHLLTECSDDDEYFRLLQREQVIRWFVADERLEQLGCDDAYARFLRLHQGLWLTDSGSLLCWGSPVEKLAASGGARLEQLRPLGVRVIWKDRLIWRGMRATIYADFLPDDEGRLPAGVEHFTIVRPQNWIAPESGAIARMLHRAAIQCSPALRRAAATSHGEQWLEQMRRRFGSPADGGLYHGLFQNLRWEWSCARIELLMSEEGGFFCQWLEHPSARRLSGLRRIEEAGNWPPNK